MVEFELFFVFVLFTGLAFYVAFRRSRKRFYEVAAQYPAPFDRPIIGSAHMGYGLDSTEIADYFHQFLHTINPPVRLWLGPFLTLVFHKPEHLSVILNSQHCVQKSMMYRFFRFEKGMTNAEPVLWRILRKRLGPALSSQMVANFVPAFDENADKLINYLDQFVGKEAFDLLPKVSVYALSSTLSNLFKVNLHAGDDEYFERFTINTERMWVTLFRRICKLWLYPEFIYRLTPAYKLECQQIARFQELSREIYRARAAMQGNSLSNEDPSSSGEILIERLERIAFQTGEIDHTTLMNNIDTFVFATNDTTSNVISSTLLMMAMHPDVQERVYREVTEVMPPSGHLTLEDLSKLTYLEMVIKETMRLIPIAAFLSRHCEKELQLDDRWTIPAGAIIAIPLTKVHRNREIWGERSDEFDPDNFLPERCAQRHPYAFIPFSGGLRNCIGMRYAWLSLKVALAKLVLRYRFLTELKLQDLKFEASFILLLANKHMMRIERR